jgi:hypothetical protein
MGRSMKFLFLFLFSMLSLKAQDVVPEQVPPEVINSAVKAVSDLGQEVVLGRYQVAVERRYPQWKERTAKRMGGMEKLEKQLESVAAQLQQQGISIIDFKPQGQPRGFEVFPGKKVETVDGRQVETLRYTKWLVLVPTVTLFRTFIEGDPRAITIESTGFQVAISDKGEDDWTFIDGSAVSVNDLRSLFLTLPRDLELPPLEKRQIR